MCNLSQGIEDKGIRKGVERTAKRLLAMGFAIEDVSKGTGLELEDIKKLEWKEGSNLCVV